MLGASKYASGQFRAAGLKAKRHWSKGKGVIRSSREVEVNSKCKPAKNLRHTSFFWKEQFLDLVTKSVLRRDRVRVNETSE